ncbi:MFS transporter [Cytobacillus firmus]|uniref:MFS transporter n=1 Tax=Cytobacillus firmus TaxID=1399 RepID=UPI001580D71A|nr:MFS transporter [Cytobacillus firmus]MBG9546270.1 macrolide transporter [Cytobacillus firmus]MBG9600752.1 macrolide transporter [Cytobacillus firmus]MBG9654674.1 macrolide transporter [Cytobacillus firmus]MDD9314054.1 MFS transporter [Cytobacillus firmus]MED1905504.1 MFS transporter [Cytobacillus firmus]
MWKNKNVWILLTGEFIAGLGLWLGIIGNLEFMQEKVPSDFLKSLILAGGLLAGIAVGPWAGRITDQISKKTVMLASGFARALSVIFMLIAIQTGSVWWMVIFLVFLQISAAFYFPALQAAIPLVVEDKDLLQLNGVHMNVSTLSRILGTALAGVLLVILPLSMLYIASLVAYLILFLITFFMDFEESVSKESTGRNSSRGSGGFKEVFPIIQGLPIVFMTLILTLVPLLFLGGFNLMVINISELQDSSSIKGLIYTAEGLGFMLGAFIVKQISQKRSPYAILFFFSFIIGLSQLLLYFANVPVLSILAFFIFGFAVGCFFPTAATIFQTRVPKEFHGRFFSFRNMLDRVTFQIVLLLTGFLLDAVGLQIMVVIFGILSLIMTAAFFAKFRKTRTEVQVKEKIST